MYVCINFRILLYRYEFVDINQRIGTSIGDECEVSILETMFCSYSNKTTCNFSMDNFPEGGGGVNNCIENNGVAFSIKNGVAHIWDFRGKKILVSRDLKMERFIF